ncbi:MAG: hypothetical protein BGO90_14400 [Legionella sp. 40-6]|nr:DUF4785 family protein [Legionella sp.]OJY26219.1 MAG: hypothetical protein BGO90_14400 [Legionella sp. 40-6]
MSKLLILILSLTCWMQSYAYPLPQQKIKSYLCDQCTYLSHEPLQAHWTISENPLVSSLSLGEKSYSYNQMVTGKQLKQGVIVSTRAPGAVIRISALDSRSTPPLQLITPTQKMMSLPQAASVYGENEALESTPLSGSGLHTWLQLKPELGFGKFILKTQNASAQSNQNYLLHVFDKFSLMFLKVAPESLNYHYGDEFRAHITLQDNDTSYELQDINAFITGAEGEPIPLVLRKVKRNQFVGTTLLTTDMNPQGENWHVTAEVFSEQDDIIVRRTARAAFSYSIPSASLINLKKISSKPLTFSALVEVATASRYVLQSVLFEQAINGDPKPLETTQSARWLTPGKHLVQFTFDNHQNLNEDSLAVGYLRLTDYGQYKTVYQYDVPIKLNQLMD